MTPQILSTGAKLTPFLLPQPARLGVLILPGGGYQRLAIGHEGKDIAAWLGARGYDAWMLEYHVASSTQAPLLNKPLDDVGAAVAAIRAEKRGEKLGIWGFSAGGHLAAMAATQPDFNLDFAVLAYPVIAVSGAAAHQGSARALLGRNPSPPQLEAYSPQLRVSLETPPVFLFHTAQDTGVPPENSLMMASALAAHQVPFELHIYQNGPHGVGLADGQLNAPDLPLLADWSERLKIWLSQR